MKWIHKLLRNIKYYCIRLLRLKNSSHQISLGFVLGFLPCWFPTFGIGPLLSVGISKIMRGNVVAAIAAASFGSILWPVLFYLNYKTGSFLVFDHPQHLQTPDIEYYPEHYIPSAKGTFHKLSKSFIVGSVINSLLFTVIGYIVLRIIFSFYREKILKKLTHGSNQKTVNKAK